MTTKTSTSTNISITQKGDVFIVKETKTKTTTLPGKEPEVEVTESVEEYKGRENLPENIRHQLEKKQTPNQPINMHATRGNFTEDVLREVNRYRKLHGVEPLKLSPQLMKLCETRAKMMAEKGEMLDSNEDDMGESVSCMSSNDPEFYVKADDVVSRWYSGSEGYDYSTESEELTAGHFTQMIWKKTKEFGVAAAKSKTNHIFVVACYSPRGNYVGQFVENVCPPVCRGRSIFANGILGIFDRNKRQRSAQKEEIDHLNREGVEWHNKYRKRHGVPGLRHSKELARYAQEWADELARREVFEHRRDGRYGENLYYFRSSDSNAKASASDACRSWYSEIRHYTFGLEPSSSESGHFTQMVWKESRELGMGLAKSKSGKQYIVANYDPPGNCIGKFIANVPGPL